ncbi:beta-lactamase family protein [Ruficoccus amylovorans]|uniref:Beta-lactamase family protein n=1 Tax=Ruficoccus amylovorans TaxID=1804625 RepID=A0A842HG83_9BACT|nr:serine hydrolase domain-containing protein [Ruficoccus amylovorans]MBC2594587.1 beta-lactamase family protein [Ruficoccus amylovorans]
MRWWQLCRGLVPVLLFTLCASELAAQASFRDGGLVIPLQPPKEDINPALDVSDMAAVRALTPGAAHPAISPEMLERFGEYITDLAEDYGLPGMALAIVQDGQVVLQQVVGYANLKTGERLTERTRFNAGPASQALTSLLAASLESPSFTYDKPAQKLWPRFRMSARELSGEVTIRQLLTMTAGIPDYTDDILDPAWARPEDVMAVIAQAPVSANPGQRFSRSLVSIAAAGYLLPRSAGKDSEFYKDYIETVQDKIFGPVGMEDATFSLAEAQASGQMASAHQYADRGRYDPTGFWQPEQNAFAPAIGLKASLRDMTRWLITELNMGLTPDGQRIADTVSVRERWQPARTEDSRNFGMGWSRRYYRNVEIIGTEGSYDRHSVAMALFPGYRTGFVALINTDSPDAQKVLSELPLGIAEMLKSTENKARQ